MRTVFCRKSTSLPYTCVLLKISQVPCHLEGHNQIIRSHRNFQIAWTQFIVETFYLHYIQCMPTQHTIHIVVVVFSGQNACAICEGGTCIRGTAILKSKWWSDPKGQSTSLWVNDKPVHPSHEYSTHQHMYTQRNINAFRLFLFYVLHEFECVNIVSRNNMRTKCWGCSSRVRLYIPKGSCSKIGHATLRRIGSLLVL